MTDSEKSEAMRALRSITTAIREVEKQTSTKILWNAGMSIDNKSATVCFVGYNEIDYNIPYHIFRTIPPKRMVIEVSRALSIDFNDYGEES